MSSFLLNYNGGLEMKSQVVRKSVAWLSIIFIGMKSDNPRNPEQYCKNLDSNDVYDLFIQKHSESFISLLLLASVLTHTFFAIARVSLFTQSTCDVPVYASSFKLIRKK